jgi:hypothetical protein
MIATLSFEFVRDRHLRDTARLLVRIFPDTDPTYPEVMALELAEKVSGKDDNLRNVLRKLFGEFLRKLPKQNHIVRMHVELEITNSREASFDNLILNQLERCTSSKRELQRQITLKFKTPHSVDITCFTCPE